MFNEMVNLSWGFAPPPSEPVAAPTPPQLTSVTIDCSTYPDPAEEAPAPQVTPDDGVSREEHPSILSPAVAGYVDPDHTAEPSTAAPNEYALPDSVSAAAVEKLRAKAEDLVVGEYDDWNLILDGAIGYGGGLSDAEIIAKVERAESPSWTTPFRYFLEVARLDGVAAGRRAYREATVRRFMLELATSARWGDYQAELGLIGQDKGR